LAAISIFTPVFYLFLIYLPFVVFGLLLKQRNFVRDYLIGFAVSFIPAIIIYLLSTYLSIPLPLPLLVFVFYLIPITAIFVLKKRALNAFNLNTKHFTFALMVLFFTSLIAINIVDSSNLFVVNHSREFYRVHLAVKGLETSNLIPLYDPAIANGEPTFLWIPPAFIMHFALPNLFLGFMNAVLLYNAQSFFALFMVVLSFGVLFRSIIGNRSNLNSMAVTAVSLLIGLNFVILQTIESIKGFYGFPISILLLSLIIDNPRRYKEFIIVMYLSVLIMLIHPSFGIATVLFASILFVVRKIYYIRDREEIRQFFKWFSRNKSKLIVTLLIISLTPLFYVLTPFMFGDFLAEDPIKDLSINNLQKASKNFFQGYFTNELSYLSMSYPVVNKIDDHKFGFFISVFGILSFVILMLLFKIKHIQNYRVFAFSYILHLMALSLAFAINLGGFFRTPYLYLLTLLGASILTLIFLINQKYVKMALIAVVFIAFLHTVPHAQTYINSIHREGFMSGSFMTNELDFIRQLPIDGRIMTYGLFSNVIDYGVGHFTGRYTSRAENFDLAPVARSIYYTKIHNANSFGEPADVIGKTGQELANYLRLGGYKYLFMNIGHPIGNYVAQQLHPSFSFALFQNGPFVVLAVNDTNYVEKVDLVKKVDEEVYKQEKGYKYTTISKNYDFEIDNIEFVDEPKEPEPLVFKRTSPERVVISGNFEDGDVVVFKEHYFSRWKAYMNNQEVPIFANNHDMILIRAIKGNEILLEYSLLTKEKIVGIISLIGFIGFFGFLVFLLKRESATD